MGVLRCAYALPFCIPRTFQGNNIKYTLARPLAVPVQRPAIAHVHSDSFVNANTGKSAAGGTALGTNGTIGKKKQYNNAVETQEVTVTNKQALAWVANFPCEKSAVQRIYSMFAMPDKERAFFVNDLGVVERQYTRWTKNLPNVRAFYAVKCNPDEMLLRQLAVAGSGFDCASGAEMETAIKIGVKAEDIIFANPIKSVKDLRFASRNGIRRMTFDNEAELRKIAQYCPDAELVLRLLPDDSGSVMRFGVKFGAPLQTIEPMLMLAQELKLKVVGCSFHIGSGCFNPEKYDGAIKLARYVFGIAEQLGLPKFTLLDLGGGFPGNPVPHERTGDVPAFEEFAAVIRRSLAEHFPDGCGVDVIAEPGRYMATAWSTLFTLVQGKRLEPSVSGDTRKKFLYYQNDGVYASFNCLMFDHAEAHPIPAYRFWEHKVNMEELRREALRRMRRQSSSVPFEGQEQQKVHQQQQMLLARLLMRSHDQRRMMRARGLHMHRGVNTPLSYHERDSNDTYGTFFGPTCDSMDCIAKDYPIEELFVGEWLGFEQFGAYTSSASSTFNGMPRPLHHYVRSQQASPMRL